jgi:hypothetical protein
MNEMNFLHLASVLATLHLAREVNANAIRYARPREKVINPRAESTSRVLQ